MKHFAINKHLQVYLHSWPQGLAVAALRLMPAAIRAAGRIPGREGNVGSMKNSQV